MAVPIACPASPGQECSSAPRSRGRAPYTQLMQGCGEPDPAEPLTDPGSLEMLGDTQRAAPERLLEARQDLGICQGTCTGEPGPSATPEPSWGQAGDIPPHPASKGGCGKCGVPGWEGALTPWKGLSFPQRSPGFVLAQPRRYNRGPGHHPRLSAIRASAK